MRPSIAKTAHVIGLISDTHGLVRPQALDALRGVDLIIHGGDIGKPEVIETLKTIAPLVAIRGNNDRGPWAGRLSETRQIRIGAAKLYLIHNLNDLDFDPAARGYAVVISGHSHKPSISMKGRVLFVNPGSAGPRRFKLPVAVGKLLIRGNSFTAEIIEIDL